MLKIMILLAVSMCLAYCSQHGILVVPLTQKRKLDIPLIVMIILLSLVVGLRTSYNDTYIYRVSFNNASTFNEYINSSPGLFDNPLFYAFQSIFRHYISANYHLFFIVIAFFTIASFIRFIHKYSHNFTFSIFLFFAIGLYVFCMAAMKQCLAMAILSYAIDHLINGKYIRYYLLLFLAILFHAFAIVFIVLPLFTQKPWTITTFIVIVGIVAFLFTFESTINSVLSVAEDVGKDINDEQVLDTASINPFRLAVYSIPTIISFVFQELLNNNYSKSKNIFTNMAILSFLIMAIGIFGGANMFGRAAIYFDFGMIIVAPWLIDEIFATESRNLSHIFVGGCYLAFFAYMVKDFSSAYHAISLIDFFQTLI